MTEKPRGKAPPVPKGPTESGRLGTDDLGNVTWEWKDEGDLLADDSVGVVQRLSALVDPSLQVKDDDDPLNPLRNNPTGLQKGYNPYNSGALAKQSFKKKKDLRELSKWIELRKKVAAKKPDGP